MKLSYRSLISVRFRHSYYREGVSQADFSVRPTQATERLLQQRGLLFKPQAGGFSVVAEVIPDSDPPRLRRAVDSENLCLRFLLVAQHSYLFSISQIDQYRMGRELFCFDNLRNDQGDGRLYLGDSLEDERLGVPVPLQTSGVLDYRFAAPVASAQLTLFDRFDNALDTRSVQAPPGESVDEYRYDLSGIDGLDTGRYRIADDHGGEHLFYLDSEQFGGNLFGVIELFNRTDRLTSDASNQVPTDYRFLDGDELTGPEAYTLQFERRSTRWRYFINKKYDNNAIVLAQLSVTGPVVFDRTDESNRVIFTAQDPIPLGEAQQAITMAHDGTAIRSLPNPSLSSPLEGSAEEGIQFSDIHVYV